MRCILSCSASNIHLQYIFTSSSIPITKFNNATKQIAYTSFTINWPYFEPNPTFLHTIPIDI